MKQIYLFSIFLLGSNLFAQFQPKAHLTTPNELHFSGLPSSGELRSYLDSIENLSGLDLFSYVLPFEAKLNTLPHQQLGSKKIHALKLPNYTLGINFQVEFERISTEDNLLIINQEDTIYSYQNTGIKNVFQRNLNGTVHIVFIDDFPYEKSGPELFNLSVSPLQVEQKVQDFGDSGPCQVNANCTSENAFPNVQRSVVRILWRNGNLQGWCTGSLMNNTNFDFKNYLLTAEHCALANGFPDSSDFRFWTFFFNFQSEECGNPSNDNGLNLQNLSGAQVIARSNDDGGENGSDFLLLELSDPVPNSFEPYYAGWSRSGLKPAQGLCYHHPNGDIKKVSSFRQPATLGTWNIVPNTHWQVSWSSTANGHGTTEAGSSGSALLDQDGLVRGVLTGGNSGCGFLEGSDFYGTVAYSWTKNGSQASYQLAPWLDPAGTNYLSLSGMDYNDTVQNFRNDGISITPNPAQNGLVTITGMKDYSSIAKAQLFNLSGKLVASRESAPIPSQGLTLRASQYQPGIYILQYKQGDLLTTRKVILL